MTDSDFNYMKEAIATDLAELLIKDFGMNIVESLDTLYNSETFTKLNDLNTGLYFQSMQYVYSFFKTELNTGTIA